MPFLSCYSVCEMADHRNSTSLMDAGMGRAILNKPPHVQFLEAGYPSQDSWSHTLPLSDKVHALGHDRETGHLRHYKYIRCFHQNTPVHIGCWRELILPLSDPIRPGIKSWLPSCQPILASKFETVSEIFPQTASQQKNPYFVSALGLALLNVSLHKSWLKKLGR